MTRFLRPSLAQGDNRAVRPAPKQRAAHYGSEAHRKWSLAVLRRAAHACQGCARTGTRLFADHIVEIADGGAALDLSNGQALCGACHSAKTAAVRAARQRR